MGWKWHHLKCHSAQGLDSKRWREPWARHSRIAIDCPHDGQVDGPVFVAKRSGKGLFFIQHLSLAQGMHIHHVVPSS